MERLKKEDKAKFMERIKKAGDPNNYETSWNEKGPVSKKKSNIKRGGLSRAQGARFELEVRKDLEDKERIVDKWSNNVDLVEGKLVQAKKNWKYNPFKKIMIPSNQGTGFPDFISIKKVTDELYSVIGVEVKMNGLLSKEEKEKCAWYLKNKIFSAIWIAKKGTKLGQIEYVDFSEKYGKKYLDI